jgi:hypothetical protein
VSDVTGSSPIKRSRTRATSFRRRSRTEASSAPGPFCPGGLKASGVIWSPPPRFQTAGKGVSNPQQIVGLLGVESLSWVAVDSDCCLSSIAIVSLVAVQTPAIAVRCNVLREDVAQRGRCMSGLFAHDAAEVALVGEAEVGGQACEVSLAAGQLLQRAPGA